MWGQIGRRNYTIVAAFNGVLAARISGGVCWVSDDSVCKAIGLLLSMNLFSSMASTWLRLFLFNDGPEMLIPFR